MTAKTNLTLTTIGIIHSPHLSPAGTPIQPTWAEEHEGRVIVDEKYEEALDDLEGFERIWLIYWLDRAGPAKLHTIPYRDNRPHGLFATRSPNRPNPIGISAVHLIRREKNVLIVRGVDMLNETPLLDIKPYVPDFDAHPSSRAGWLDEKREERTHADERFHGTADKK